MSIKSSIPMTFGEKDQDDFSITLRDGEFPVVTCVEHWHSCFELFFVRDGRHVVSIDGREQLLSSGDIAVIPPYRLHGTSGVENEKMRAIIFGYIEPVISSHDLSYSNMKFLAPFRHARAPEELVLSGESPSLERLRELLVRGSEVYFGSSPTRELIMRSIILEVHALLYELLMFVGASGQGTPDTRSLAYICDAQSYVESHLTEDISPYAIAEHLHLSYSHLSRLCRSVLGVTVGELICRMRMNLAEQLFIDDRTLAVTECALAVGFSDVSYFINRFRRVKGISPGEFKRLLAAGEETRR